MKLIIMTDMEGVAGVLNADEYLDASGRLYEVGRELAARECNAAIEGAIAAERRTSWWWTGTGPARSTAACCSRQRACSPDNPSRGPSAAIRRSTQAFIVGQHAMSNADGGHLFHTNSWQVEEWRCNGRPIGELGKELLLFGACGVRAVLVTGDEACTAEARALVPEIEAVAVKAGVRGGSAAGLAPPRTGASTWWRSTGRRSRPLR